MIEALVKVLEDGVPRTAKQLANEIADFSLPASKGAINAALYGDSQRFEPDGSMPPLWSLRNGATGPSPQQKQTRRDLPHGRVVQSRLPALYKWQVRALADWERQSRRGVVEAVTGAGKTLVGLAATKAILEEGGRVLVLVPSLELQHQWADEFSRAFSGIRVRKNGGGETASLRTADVVISTVHSARNGIPLPAGGSGLLIADEVHRYGAAGFSKALKQQFAARLGLTATYERNDEGLEDHLIPYFGPVCASVTYKEALPANYVSRFKLALIGAQLTPLEWDEYSNHDAAFKSAFGRLVNGTRLKPKPFGAFMEAVSVLAEGGAGRMTLEARRLLRAFSGRRQVLADSQQKLHRLEGLAPSIAECTRALVFSQTISGAETARDVLSGLGIRAASLHSKVSKVERRAIMNDFRRRRIHVLTAAQVLDEGIDVPEADLAVILAATQTRRQMIQRMGRVLRRKDPPRLARLAMVYAEGTPEDPASGGHAEFLDEALTVADNVRAFPSPAQDRLLNDYLRDNAIKGPYRESRTMGVEVVGRGIFALSSADENELEWTAPGLATVRNAHGTEASKAFDALSGTRSSGRSSAASPEVASDQFGALLASLWESVTGQPIEVTKLERLRNEGTYDRLEGCFTVLGAAVFEELARAAFQRPSDFLTIWLWSMESYKEPGAIPWSRLSRSQTESFHTEILAGARRKSSKRPGRKGGDERRGHLESLDESSMPRFQPSEVWRTGLPPIMQYGDDTG